MPEKKKLLFVGQNLNMGGVQKAFVNQLNATAKSGEYDIDVFVFSKGVLEKDLPKNIKIIEGGRVLRLISKSVGEVREAGGKLNLLLRLGFAAVAKTIGSERFYRLVFSKMPGEYDTAVSYFTDVPAGVFNKGTNVYVADYVGANEKIAWIHTDPILGGFDREYCLRIYRPFDRIICVSEAVREKFNGLVPEYKEKTETRHNVFDSEKIKSLSAEFEPFEKSTFDIVTVARADNSSKRIDGIVRVCERLIQSGIRDFKWRIIGGGPDLEKNMELANEKGLWNIISLEGEKDNPYPYIDKSDLFALYSAYEGFPLVIGEAMILNTPILTTNYAAAREQIPEQFGDIANTDEEFYELLKKKIIGINQTCMQPHFADCINTYERKGR